MSLSFYYFFAPLLEVNKRQMRYFIKLGYRGAGYHGWQVQPQDSSVQQTIEETLATLLRVPTPVIGAGRTDAGVNARLMAAHVQIIICNLVGNLASEAPLHDS